MSHHCHRSKRLLTFTIALAGAGAWLCGELLKRNDNIWRVAGANQGMLSTMCRMLGPADSPCGHASKDRWSEIVLPFVSIDSNFHTSLHRVVLPVAFMGLAYFVFIFVWFLFMGPPQPVGSQWRRLPLHLATLAAIVSMCLPGLSALGYAPWCIPCLIVHALNLMLFATIRRLFRAEAQPDRSAAGIPASLFHAVVPSPAEARAIGFALACIAGLWTYRSAHLSFKEELGALMPYKRLVTSLRQDADFLMREHFSQPQHEIPPRPGEHESTEESELVVFTDFECPSCYCNMRRIQEEIVPVFRDRLRVSVRHFPLCRDCNPGVKNMSHVAACGAARAAEAARHIGGERAFQRMHDLLFENRSRLGTPLYESLAAQIGLDVAAFQSELSNATVSKIVQADIQTAARLGVNGTPVMFLNGRRVADICQTRAFWEAVADRNASAAQLAGDAWNEDESIPNGQE